MLETHTIFREIKIKDFNMTKMHKMVTIHGINQNISRKYKLSR